MLHESHGAVELLANDAIAALRVWVARMARVRPERMAREERRRAIAQGMLEARRSTW
jgi:hypothetical protein